MMTPKPTQEEKARYPSVFRAKKFSVYIRKGSLRMEVAGKPVGTADPSFHIIDPNNSVIEFHGALTAPFRVLYLKDKLTQRSFPIDKDDLLHFIYKGGSVYAGDISAYLTFRKGGKKQLVEIVEEISFDSYGYPIRNPILDKYLVTLPDGEDTRTWSRG